MATRRDLLNATVGFCAYALLREARAAVSTRRADSASRWIERQDELARGLADGSLSQVQWHDAINDMAREVDLQALARLLRRAKQRQAGNGAAHDPPKRFVTFLTDEGTSVRWRYAAALFDFDADSVITPHAHQHMASAHLVLEGRLRVRTYERVRDDASALILRPALDQIAEPGHAIAMTTARDNVHWFASRSARAMTLDVIIEGLDVGKRRYVIQPVDPLGGIELKDGTIRAPLISFEQSALLYPARR